MVKKWQKMQPDRIKPALAFFHPDEVNVDSMRKWHKEGSLDVIGEVAVQYSGLKFGSDQMTWPEQIPKAIESIESAEFLTAEQKRDILYNNAAKFLRLSEQEIKKHNGN